MVESRREIQKAVAEELRELAKKCQEKRDRLKKLGDTSAYNLACFLTDFTENAAEEFSKEA